MQRIISTSLIIALLGLTILWTGCGGGKQTGRIEISGESKGEWERLKGTNICTTDSERRKHLTN